MGRRGPAPTPTTILKLRGSWRGDANPGEPEPPKGEPDAPDWLTKDAAAVWRQMLAQLAPLRVLTRVDGAALARYCDALVRWQKAAAFLEKNGDVYTIKDAKGVVKCVMPFPQVAMYHKLGATLLRLEQEFGLTPAGRSRVQVAKQDDAPNNQAKGRFFRAG